MQTLLVEEGTGGGRLRVTQVIVPPGEEMREHDHGASEALLVPLAGELLLTSGVQREAIASGTVVLLDKGERVRLANRSSEPFTMVMVFTPVDTPASVGPSRWVYAGPADQLEDDTAMHLDLAGQPVCLARSRGAVYAMLDECSHGQVELSEGDVEDGCVECWLHGSRFDLATGAPTGPPAVVPVPAYPVRIVGASIEVELPAPTSDVDPG